MSAVPEDLGERLILISRMTDERLRAMTPAERDRMLQTHLAATRSPQRNFELLCRMTDSFASIRRERLLREQEGKPCPEDDSPRRHGEHG